MMYSEFAEATKCRDNEFNHKVFERLELIYMNDDSMSKEEVYEWGKKLVDNSKTESELELERQLRKEIAELKDSIEYEKKTIEMYKGFLNDVFNTPEETKEYKRQIKLRREWIAEYKNRIHERRWILGEV